MKDERSIWYRSLGWRGYVAELVRARGEKCEQCGAKGDGGDCGRALRALAAARGELIPGDSGVRLDGHHREDPFPTHDVIKLLDPANIEVLCTKCHRHAHGAKLTTTCETCGDPFSRIPSRPRRFCSIPCRDLHPDFAKLATRACVECGRDFQPARPDVVRCSVLCRTKHVARMKVDRRVEMTCEGCHKAFRVPACRARAIAQNKTVSCSRACSVKVKASHAESNRPLAH